MGLCQSGKRKQKEVDMMSKISAFFLATAGLSLAILIPCGIWFNVIVMKLQEVGLIVTSEATAQLWQGFAILAFIVIVSVVTLMALVVFGGGDNNVVR
jgi:hypothetical protein